MFFNSHIFTQNEKFGFAYIWSVAPLRNEHLVDHQIDGRGCFGRSSLVREADRVYQVHLGIVLIQMEHYLQYKFNLSVCIWTEVWQQ